MARAANEATTLTRGEIWMFGFQPPDQQRPVLVLTRPDMIGVLNTVTVAPLTRRIRDVPSEVVVGIDSGLKQESAINLHNLVTIPRSGLRRFVGTVSPAVLARVRSALLFALGFEP